MEVENDRLSEERKEPIIINSDNLLILHDINLKTERNLLLFVDTKNDIRQYSLTYFINLIEALNKAQIIEINVGMRNVEQEQNDREGLQDWIYFLKGIGKQIKTLRISIGNYILNLLNLEQFGKELLRLYYLEQLHLQIDKEKILGVNKFTQLGEALRKMIQLKELSMIFGDNCSLGANGAKKLFYGLEACEKIEKLKLHFGCYNRLNAEGTQIISTAVGQLKRVSDFDLFIAETNDIGNQGMQSITESILQQHLSKSAESLSLKISDMKGIKAESIVQMFSSIEEFSRLKDLSVNLGVKKEMKEDSIKIIRDSLKKLKSLLTISMSITADRCALSATPMVDLLTQFQFSNNLVRLQLIIPPQNEFNNAALSLFAVNLKILSELQVFSLEIQENNIQGNTVSKRKEPANRGDNKKTAKQQEEIVQTRGISDISESLSSLKKLEKVEWIISTQNDVSDGGWEMLSRSRSLKEFRVKIGEGCKLQDEGLHSLSKISSSISLDCLRVEVGNENETSEGGWNHFLSSVNLLKMKDFTISVGAFNECSEKSLDKLAAVFQKSLLPIEYLTLDFKESSTTNSESIEQLSESLKSMVKLKQLAFSLPNDIVMNIFTINSLSKSIERMSDLRDLKISFRVQACVEFVDEIKLCLVICSLKKLDYLDFYLQSYGYLSGNSIMQPNPYSLKISPFPYKNRYLLDFRTKNGLQFKKQLKTEYISQNFVDKFTQSLALLVFVQYQIVYLHIIFDSMDIEQKILQFTQLTNALSLFKQCFKLKLNFNNHFLDEISLNQLAYSINCMQLLSKVSLRLDGTVLSLKAAETLSGFFKKSPRITKIQLMCRFHSNKAQSQAQFLLMSSILACPNLMNSWVFIESYFCIKFEFKDQQKIEDFNLLCSMQEKEKVGTADDDQQIAQKIYKNDSIQQSTFEFIMKDSQEPANDETIIYLGQFLLSTKKLQKIILSVSSNKQINIKEAGIIQEGIKNQANLKNFQLDFFGKCFVSGEGAVLISQSFSNQKNKNEQQIMNIQADDSFSIDNAFTVLVKTLNDQSLDIKGNMMNITGRKFIVATNNYALKNNYIFKTNNPKKITLCQGNKPDQSKTLTISQITDFLSQVRGISDLEFNASECILEGNQDWNSFRQLSSLTRVSIQDQSPNTSSRFLSLESSLSHMTHLQSLTLTLSHTHENGFFQDTITSFGTGLINLKNITQLTITFINFNFGKDGGQALACGIEGMTDLEQLHIDCRNPLELLTEGIKCLSKVVLKSEKIEQFNLNFSGIHSSLEISYFDLLKKILQNKKISTKTSSISVKGELHQVFSQVRRFFILDSTIDLNLGKYFHEIQLPQKYCQNSDFEIKTKCAEILQLYYASNEEIYSIENVTVVFNFPKPQQIEPNLIFLQTLFSVLHLQKRRVKTLAVVFSMNQNGQFQLIFDKALKDIKLVDTLQLRLTSPLSFQFNFQELYSITSLNNLTTLEVFVNRIDNQDCKILRQRILRKMKRLCSFKIKIMKLISL